MVGIFQGRMDEDLLRYLQDTSIIRMAQDELERHGFGCCVDYRSVPNHIYYEGYFHASALKQSQAATEEDNVGLRDHDDLVEKGLKVDANGCLSTINPRTGLTFDKPPAPKRLRAFFGAFRTLNRALFARLAQDVRALGPECHVIAAMFEPEGGSLMGDLAVQIHFGDEISDESLGLSLSLFHAFASACLIYFFHC